MKNIKTVKEKGFTGMFNEASPFKGDISDWTFPIKYYLDELNSSQLSLLIILDIEPIKNENGRMYIVIEDTPLQKQLSNLSIPKQNYKENLNKIPRWIRRIFKADDNENEQDWEVSNATSF